MSSEIEPQAEKHSTDVGKEVSPKVSSQQGQENKQENVNSEEYKSSDSTTTTAFPNTPSNTTNEESIAEPKPLVEVAIVRPEKKEHLKKDLDAIKKAYFDDTFDSKIRSYTVDTGIPETTFTMREVVTQSKDKISMNQLALEFIFTYVVKAMVEKSTTTTSLPDRNAPIVIDVTSDDTEENNDKPEPEMEEIVTNFELKFVIEEKDVTFRDGSVSIVGMSKNSNMHKLEKILRDFTPSKTLAEVIEEIGKGTPSHDTPEYGAWQKEVEKLQRKYEKEHTLVIEKKRLELFNGVCSQFYKDKDHIASLKSSIEAANAYKRAKNEFTTTFMGVDIPSGYFREGQFLKMKGEPKYNKNGEEIKDSTVDKHLGNITIITEIAHTDKGIDEVKVVTQTSKGLTEMWVQESDLKSRAGIMAISKKGASFNEIHVKDIIGYFITLLEEDTPKHQIKHTYMTRENAWKDDYHTFVCGNTTITDIKEDGKFRHYEFADKSIARNLEPNGNIEYWVEAIKQLIVYDLCQKKFCAAYGSPLVDYLNADSFIFYNEGDSGGAKTLLDLVVSSGICKPEGSKNKHLIVTSNATEAGMEFYFVAFSGLPMMADELSHTEASKNKDFVSRIIYLFHSGIDKLRGKVTGEMRDQRTFKGILRINGENPISEESANTGEKARVVTCYDRVEFTEESKKRVGEYKRIMNMYQSYGHFMPLYIKKVMEHGREAAIKLFLEYKEYFMVNVNTTANNSRMAQDFAVLAVAGYYVNLVFKDLGIPTFDHIAVIKNMADTHMKENPIEEQDITALRKFMAWFGSNHKLYNEPEDIEYTIDGNVCSREDKKSYNGYYAKGLIETFSENFFAAMEKIGYPEKRARKIIRKWNERGLLIPNPSGAAVGKVSFGTRQVPAVRLWEDKVEQLLNPWEEEAVKKMKEDEEKKRAIEARLEEMHQRNEGYKFRFYREMTGDEDFLFPYSKIVLDYVEEHKYQFEKWKLTLQVKDVIEEGD